MTSRKGKKRDNHDEQRVSLSFKLTFSLILIVVIITLFSSVLVYGFFSVQSKKQYKQKSENYLNYLKENLEISLWNMDEDSIVKICKSFSKNEEIGVLIVRDYKGAIIFSKGKDNPEDSIRIKSDIKFNGKLAGHITFGLTKKFYNEKNRQLLFTTFLIMAVVALGLSFSTRLVLDRVLQKPIDSLFKKIIEIKEGNYEDSILQTTYPEIEAILGNFNQMAEQVADREKTLKEINQKLENEIEEHRLSELENRKLEKQIRVAQKMEAIGTLAGGIAHDFNNILSAIIGFSELLKEDLQTAQMSEQFIDQILQGGSRAKELVSQILLFSRQSEDEMVQVNNASYYLQNENKQTP